MNGKTYFLLYESHPYDMDSEYVQLTKEQYKTLLLYENGIRS